MIACGVHGIISSTFVGQVDADQEMFACGVVNIVSSVFSGFVAAGSMSRSLVQEGAGGRTQVASLVAAALVFVVIMVLGPYLYHLPGCVLSAIIVVSLRAMILKVRPLVTNDRLIVPIC